MQDFCFENQFIHDQTKLIFTRKALHVLRFKTTQKWPITLSAAQSATAYSWENRNSSSPKRSRNCNLSITSLDGLRHEATGDSLELGLFLNLLFMSELVLWSVKMIRI